ncbi:acyl CoA:acetate/3-ketoacid CoA transferase [Affinibrenneria salicis]|uniref:Acetate CoA-transferase YdiF n=1 Tax=Affinibrenneria salicis TaxID=2590031 RepID=A0A5J5G2W0_9GAMM|nr:CoA-transferase [Affinibrenneria salicis]KAA9001102.1 acyl CoA:acetate/3-ketoacid CoA transferase [Affinibrenneria salicis]
MKNKFISAGQAAALINNGDTLCTVGMTLISAAESILKAIEARFINEGTPRDLTLVHAAGQCDRQRGNQHFAHPGLVTRIIGSHWGLAPRWMTMINNDEVEAWCLPQGQMVHLYGDMAAGLPGRLSQVGLGTFVDPRQEGGRMNPRTRRQPHRIEHLTLRGEEFLFYPAIPLDVVIIRGTHADSDGNLTTDEEAMKLEVLPAVLAAKRYGAKVLAQVKYRVARGSLHPKKVTVPGTLIDAIVVCDDPQNDHRQTSGWAFDPALCGDIRLPTSQSAPLPLNLRKLIGRIACRYLTPGCVINLGTGIPNDVIGAVIHEEGVTDDVTITVESGIYGGLQAGGADFGIGRNLSAMISHQEQMLYYNGAGVDITYMGAGEMDPLGHVNATRLGDACPGAGGFIDITQNARHVVFCSSFTAKGLDIACRQGQLRILREGEVCKLVKAVNQISYNGELARAKGQKMHFVTERAVFELRREGPVLTEIAPGIDLERDIVRQMAFRPLIAPDLTVMDSALFNEAPFGLASALTRQVHLNQEENTE